MRRGADFPTSQIGGLLDFDRGLHLFAIGTAVTGECEMAVVTKRRTEYEARPLGSAGTDRTQIVNRLKGNFLLTDIAILPIIPPRRSL